MSGHIADLSPKQETILKQFKEALSDVLKPEHDDCYCLRWLRARDFNPKKSELMLRNTLEWRKKHGVDTILEDFCMPEIFTKYFTGGFFGNDKDGAFIWVDPFGCIDIKGIMKSMKKSDIYLSKVYLLEYIHSQFKEESLKQGRRVDHMVIVFDMDKFGIAHLWKPGIDTLTELLSMFEGNYPETLKRVYVFNAPSIFPIVWKIVRPFLSDATANKVVMLGSDYKTSLLKYIDADQLPEFYGGTCQDPDGDPRCRSRICYGGEVPQSCYLKVTAADLERFTQATIKRGSSLPIECSVKTAESVIRWNFTTSGYDLGFGVYRRTDNKVQKWDKMENLLEPRRVNSHLVPEDGSITCNIPGMYVLRFDNSYSWTRSKKIHYLIEVLEPDNIEAPTVSSDKPVIVQPHQSASADSEEKGSQVVMGDSVVDEEHKDDVCANGPTTPD